MKNWVALPLYVACLCLAPCWSTAQSSVIQGTISWDPVNPSFAVVHASSNRPSPTRVLIPIAWRERYQRLFRTYPSDTWEVTVFEREGMPTLETAFRLTDVTREEMGTVDPLLALAIGPYPPVDKSRSLNFDVEQQEVVYLTNLARDDEGLRPLKQVNLLHNAADGHSDRMATMNFFAHCDIFSKKDPFTRMQDAGYNWNSAGENIAAGQTSAQEVMNGQFGWMNSPGHRANILNPDFREIGVGYEFSNDNAKDVYDQNGDCNGDGQGGPFRRYWTQNFGTRNSVYPMIINREQASVDDPQVELYIYAPSSAQEMRFKNEDDEWSAWVTYKPTYSWQLSTSSGTKTVFSEVRTSGGQVYNGVDNIDLNFDCNQINISNQTINDSRTVQACEVTVGGNVTVYGSLIIDAVETTLRGESQIMQGSTLEIRPSAGSN